MVADCRLKYSEQPISRAACGGDTRRRKCGEGQKTADEKEEKLRYPYLPDLCPIVPSQHVKSVFQVPQPWLSPRRIKAPREAYERAENNDEKGKKKKKRV
ncbi:aspartyl/glutamyl-tRNA(Asn/Gln) amidotransferasesubunit B [Striga asiatica]|uniref:Aspartyl/glutamyl-tRNA(Asn/Gln) amidotransferasesubunit B n=1 Tax=Striga asiatica TaxID=4170 RepID=A0A5A7R678_STRAF|nr:aspartyl/glutamyl-tRNA(Asn/Gln) amidotransferasesubunit B [Striga asiatica]